MRNKINEKSEKRMLIEKEDYQKIKEIYSANKTTFQARKQSMDMHVFTKVNWSDTFLDFTGFESIFNQSKKIKIYDVEKPSTVKNLFIKDKLVYSVNNENPKWGSAFMDYELDCTIWFLFEENIDDEMILRQIRIKYTKDNRIIKSLYYLFNDDFEDDIKETFMIDIYQYNSEDILVEVVRNGFYQSIEKILPERIFSFEYEGVNMKIWSTQEKFAADPSPSTIMYEGKVIKPIV
ncbi:hypothetical protein ACYSNM_12865 [Myroides sp. LJL116]